MKYTHALVSTVDSICGFPPRGVYLFESERAAIEFAARKLSGLGQCKAVEGGYLIDESSEIYSAAEAIEHFQWQLERIEYFHIMDVMQTCEIVKGVEKHEPKRLRRRYR